MHENFYLNVKVYYEDTDAGGVVYYANYLKYLERARTEALATIGLSNLEIKNKLLENSEKFRASELLFLEENHLKITKTGKFLSDGIASDLFLI